jgi:hypothetical protein
MRVLEVLKVLDCKNKNKTKHWLCAHTHTHTHVQINTLQFFIVCGIYVMNDLFSVCTSNFPVRFHGVDGDNFIPLFLCGSHWLLLAIRATCCTSYVRVALRTDIILFHPRSLDKEPGLTHSPCVAGDEARRFQPPCCDANNGPRHRVGVAVGFLDVHQHRQHYRGVRRRDPPR